MPSLVFAIISDIHGNLEALQAAGIDVDEDVYLVPFPAQKTLGQQLVEAFQVTAIRAVGPRLEWPEPIDKILAWTRHLPEMTPLLIPPVLVEIR